MANDFVARKPSHKLKVRDKGSGKTSVVGVGWQDDRGFIFLQLDLCTVLDQSKLAGCTLTLFPADEWPADE